MASIVELRNELEAKNSKLERIFGLAGAGFDLDLVTVLDGSAEEKYEEIQRIMKDRDELAAKVDRLGGLAEAAEKIRADVDENSKVASRPHMPAPESKGEKGESDPMLGFKSAGDFFRAVRFAGAANPDVRLKAASGLNETNPGDGGFLVPPQVVNELLRRVYETGALASRVRRIPITSNSIKINAIDESSRVDGSRWGGIQAYWEGEASQYTAAQPKFRQMQLTLKKLTGLCYATDELLDDANALASVVSQGFQEEFAYKVDTAIMRGTGVGQPKGILNESALVSVSAEAGQAADTIEPENLMKMWSRMWARSRSNAVWFINQDIEPSLFQLGLGIGAGGGSLVYMPAGGLSGSPFGTLFGRPVVPVEQCSTIGDAGDIVLADLSQYLWVDKGGVNAQSSMHVRFLYDEMAYKFTYRADGQSVWNSALTPAYGSNTLSPFVALAAR